MYIRKESAMDNRRYHVDNTVTEAKSWRRGGPATEQNSTVTFPQRQEGVSELDL